MKRAYIFPGQGSQFEGMAKDLLELDDSSKELLYKSNEVLGFDIVDVMTNGSMEDLTRTEVTQPAVYIYSVLMYMSKSEFPPDMVAGHSLGEYSALCANQVITYEDGLKLVSTRANAMQVACEKNPGTMAAVLGLADDIVANVCQTITDEIVVPANFNSPGQVVISGTILGVQMAMDKMSEAGAKRVIPLKVGGAFHSPLMQPAQDELENAINNTDFGNPICPIYQNVTARAVDNPEEIKFNLITQLTSSVRWTQSVMQMKADGAEEFTEYGPGNVLSGLVRKIK